MASEEPLTVIAIGPLGNIGEALSREPRIAPKLHFVAGAVYRGYASSKYPRGSPSTRSRAGSTTSGGHPVLSDHFRRAVGEYDHHAARHLRSGQAERAEFARIQLARAAHAR